MSGCLGSRGEGRGWPQSESTRTLGGDVLYLDCGVGDQILCPSKRVNFTIYKLKSKFKKYPNSLLNLKFPT